MVLRPLVLAMNQWVADESALPPASVYPRIADGDLVAWDAVGFPELPASASRPSRTWRIARSTARRSGPRAS